MSSLNFMEKLLDGIEVEWKSLGELGELVRGNGLPKTDFTESGVAAIHYGQIYTYYGLSTETTISFVSHETAKKLKKVNTGDVVITNTSENFEDVGKALVYLGKPQAVTGGHATIFKPSNIIIGKYFAYFTQTSEFFSEKRKLAKGTKVIDVSATDMAKIKIPIPCPENQKKSLEIQAEIVRILDAFTSMTAELTAELSLRKKQYSYYRDQLLSFKEGDVEWKMLGDEDFFEVGSGGTPSKSKPEYWDDGNIPWLKSESCNNESVYSANNFITDLGLAKSSAKLLQAKTTLIALVGATIFKTAFLEFPAATNQNIASIKSKNPKAVNDKFIFYYITNLYEMLKSEMRDYGMLNLTTLRQFRVPVPAPEKQARIVAILDKFDALANSITEGLPREIELRQKQYEYYRDLLLSFPKPDAEVTA